MPKPSRTGAKKLIIQLPTKVVPDYRKLADIAEGRGAVLVPAEGFDYNPAHVSLRRRGLGAYVTYEGSRKLYSIEPLRK